MTVIKTQGLTKKFGSFTAVNSIDLDVRAGDIYGFLGANGSGKTTTVRMLLGLVLATSGSIEILDEPMPKAAHSVLPRLGALVEGPGFYGHLSGRANLSTFDASGPSAGRRGRVNRVTDAMEQVGLADVGRRPVKAYSLGMRQRLGLAAALLRKPALLVLDEPTNGLDPQGIREIRELLLQLHATGTTIFLSSHLLAEVEQLCTRVGVLDRGQLIAQEELSVLTRPTGRTIIRTPDADEAVRILDTQIVARSGDRLIVDAADAAELNALLVAKNLRVTELGAERPTLEEAVLALTDAHFVHQPEVRA